jgi:hypothetical protein
MKLPAVKFAVAAVLSFASSITVFVSHWSSEPNEPVLPSIFEADRQVSEVVLLRTTAKYRIARDVIAGRLSFIEAATLFGQLNRVRPQDLGWRLDSTEDRDEAALCRQVLTYVLRQLDDEPDCREATVARLRAQFEEEQCKAREVGSPELLTSVSLEKLLAQAREELVNQGVLPREGRTIGGN